MRTIRSRIRTDEELEVMPEDSKVRVVFVDIPASLDTRFLEAALQGGFTKREFGMIAMMLAIRKMGMKSPKFRERARVKAKLKLLVIHPE